MNVSQSKKLLDINNEMMPKFENEEALHKTLSSYRSAENLHPGINSVNKRVNSNLKRTIASQSSMSSMKRLYNSKNKRDKAASCIVPNEVSQKLYDDAKRRQSKKLENMQNNRKRDRSVSVQVNNKSIQYLMKRFIDDFKAAMDSQGLERGMINYFNAGQILKEMGFMSSKNNIETNEERILFIDMWRSMKGDNNEGVQSDNLKIFLGAIEGFKFEISKNKNLPNEDYKIVDKVSPNRKSTSPRHKFTSTSSSSRRKNSTYPKIDPIFDQDNIIQLSQSEIKYIQDYYFIFARNRSNHLSNKNHQKQAEFVEEMSKVSHRPKIDK